MSTANQGCNGNPQKLVVIYPGPGTGHLNPTVELGRLLVSHGLAVTIVVRGQQAGDVPVAAASSATGDASANPCLSFHCIPEVSLPSDAPEEGDHVAQVFALTRASNHELRDFLRAAIPTALLLDFFCGSALDVGAELGIPTYFFYPSCIASLAFLLYLPVVHGKTALSFRDLGRELVRVPGVPPIPVNDLPVALLDRSNPSYRHFLALSEQMCKSRGVIVNSCRSLEPRATDAVVSGLCTPPEHTTPPIYCIGPLIKSEVVDKRREECLAWLDTQPKASVLFLCFGSMGRFSAEQIKEMAVGLEMSGQRFLWVVRSPPGDEQPAVPDLDALLPKGFLDRTKDRGLVVKSRAPQWDVLQHGAVSGFVTHCGWNSILEAVMAGVPMLGWPLYAEQRMNRVFLVEEMRLAVAVEGCEEGIIVTAEEIEEKVRWLMDSDGGRELRERTLAAMREAKEALISDGGGSKTELLKLVEQWKS